MRPIQLPIQFFFLKANIVILVLVSFMREVWCTCGIAKSILTYLTNNKPTYNNYNLFPAMWTYLIYPGIIIRSCKVWAGLKFYVSIVVISFN